MIEEYGRKTGQHVILPDKSNGMDFVRHPKHQHMICHYDGIAIRSSDKKEGTLEAKIVSSDQRKKWEDGPPPHYLLQLYHNMEVMGSSWGSLVVLFGFDGVKWLDVERNDRLLDHMVQKEREFWQLVKSETPPPAEMFEGEDLKLIAATRDVDVEQALSLPESATELDRLYEEALADRTRAQQVIDKTRGQLAALTGDHKIGQVPERDAYWEWIDYGDSKQFRRKRSR